MDWLIAFGFAIVTIVPMVTVYYPLFNEVRTVYENDYYATLAFAFVGFAFVYGWYMSTVLRVEL